MTNLTLPQIDIIPPKRSVSDHKITASRKVKTLTTERDAEDSMQVILQAKTRLKTQFNPKKKGAQQLNTELDRHYRREEQKIMNQIDSSDQEKSIQANFRVIDNTEGLQKSVSLKSSRGKLRSLHTERTCTIEHSTLIGKDVVSKFYNVHKVLEKVQQQERYEGKTTPITLILRVLQDLRIPPKKLQFIRDRGSQNILDLRNCGLGKGNIAKLVHVILDKLAYFDTINISHNSIHFDIVGELIPQLGKLKHLDLSYNKIGKQGCAMLSQVFKDNTTKIETLELQSNDLSDGAGVCLLRHISKYTKLKILNLSKNNLSKDTAYLLSHYLIERDITLTELYLHWNQIHEEGSLPLFQAMSKNNSVRVFDFSWNHQRQSAKMITGLKKFLEDNKTCVHFDIAYCNISLDSSKEVKKSLALNHAIYGIHYEGNHGFIDSRGNLILEDKNSKLAKMIQYPMPLVKSVARRIRGLEECQQEGCYGMDQRKNVCWICQGYQEFEFRLPKTQDMDGKECFVHLDREGFRGFKLLEKDNQFFVQKMLPKGQHRFFFTVGRDDRMTSPFYDKLKESILIEQYRIGKVRFYNVFMQQTNVINLKGNQPPIDSDYTSNIQCRPRQKLNRINLKNLVLRKRLIERLQKIKFNLKELPVVKQFRPPEEKMQDLYKKCLQFDFENSKIPNLLNLQNSASIEQILLKNYKYIICAYDRLSCYNATQQGNYTIPQQSIIDFCQEVRWVTKRIPISKILVKYVSTLRKDGTMKRPQFIEFLIRVAEEKWAREDKEYFKSSFHIANLEKEKELQRSRRDWRKQSQIGIMKEESARGSVKNQSVAMLDNRQEYEQDDSKSITKSIAKSLDKRTRQTLSLQGGLSRLLKPFMNFYNKHNPQSWRQSRFMTPDIRLLMDAYQSFTKKLFDRYSKLKVYNKQKTISLHDFVSIFMKCGVATSRSQFDQGEVSFIMSRIIEPNDNQLFTLGYEEMYEAIARLADLISLPPIGYANHQIFASEKHRAEIPLVFKMESMLFLIYKCHPELTNSKLSSMFEGGIFKEEIDTYIELATQKYMNETDFFIEPRINTRIKFNEMSLLSELTLKDLIEALKLKYSNAMIRKYSLVEELEEDDEQDEDPPE